MSFLWMHFHFIKYVGSFSVNFCFWQKMRLYMRVWRTTFWPRTGWLRATILSSTQRNLVRLFFLLTIRKAKQTVSSEHIPITFTPTETFQCHSHIMSLEGSYNLCYMKQQRGFLFYTHFSVVMVFFCFCWLQPSRGSAVDVGLNILWAKRANTPARRSVITTMGKQLRIKVSILLFYVFKNVLNS